MTRDKRSKRRRGRANAPAPDAEAGFRPQYAALPFRLVEGEPQVMLITSRDTGRWIVPKGWPERRLSGPAAAAREAFEEAGLLGVIGDEPIGRYVYDKRLRSGRTVPCTVSVFLFRVQSEAEDWPEKGQRERRWMSPAEAALLVSEGGLAAMLLTLAAPDTRPDGGRLPDG